MLSDRVEPHGRLGQCLLLLRARHDDNVPEAKLKLWSIGPNVLEG